MLGLILGISINASNGFDSLVQSFLGLVVGLGVLLVPFALGWIGAGDVKLLGVIGALLGVSWLPRVFFYSALVAGVIAIGYISVGSATLTGFKSLWTDVKLSVVSMGHVLPKSVSERTETKGGGSVPWGVAFAIGTIIAYYFDYNGQWAGL